MFMRPSIRLALAACVLSALPALAARAADATVTTLDLSKATRIVLPAGGRDAVAFTTPDGKQGWVRHLSGEQIPTPAYAAGRIFTGAGMSTSLFLAIDAATGATIWEKPTTDNGPTSPVVSDKYVCYNTESCDTESRDYDSGDMVWHQTTGGSLLTQPVVAGNMLVIPHPTMARVANMADDAFRMLAVDIKTGERRWDRNITADVLAAPVTAAGRVFFTCTDGRLFCQTFGDEPGWHIVAKATSAPVVVGDTLAVTTEEKNPNGGAIVSIRRYSVSNGAALDEKGLAPTVVGSEVLAPSQRAGWDYQGPKVAAYAKSLFNAPGLTINSVNLETGEMRWRTNLAGPGLSNSANALTPVALGEKKVYLGTHAGQVLAVKQSDGTLDFAYDLGQPLASQPILAEGSLYIGTANGMLVCIKLQDPDAKDWHAWGGNAQHNKVN